MSSKRLEEWRKDWTHVLQIKKSVTKAGGYTITINVSKEVEGDVRDHISQFLEAIKEMVK